MKAKGEESNPEARSLPDETVLAENLRSTFPPLLFHLQAVKEDPFCVSIGTMRCALVCFVWKLYCIVWGGRDSVLLFLVFGERC